MASKSRYFLMILCMATSLACYAQPGRDKVDERPRPGDPRTVSLLEGKSAHIDQNFENTLMGIVSHVSSNFAAIKGKEVESENSVTRYTVLRGVTGVKTASIVFDTSWRYEGVIYEDTSKSKFGNYYEEYAAHLAQSLPRSGYQLSKRKNTSEQLAEYPDLSYRYHTGEVTIELIGEYSSINGIYSLTVVVKK